MKEVIAVNPAEEPMQTVPLSEQIADVILARISAGQVSPYDLHDKDKPLSIGQTASLLGHNYFWVSRNYKKLGLRPSRIGGKLLFNRKEILALVESRRVRTAGRPRVNRF